MSKLHKIVNENTDPKIVTTVGGPSKIPTVDETAERKGVELEPEDYIFIDYILNDISLEGKLPFILPVESMPRIIVDAALWFYRNCNEATEERFYVIKNADLWKDGQFNRTITLPYQIEAIAQVYPIMSCLVGMAMRFSREPMYYASAMNSLSSYSSSYNSPYRQMTRDQAFEESVVRMFEYSAMKTMFRQGVRFDFNPNTHRLNIMSNTDKDLVLSVFQRIPLKYLYNDINFRKYCVALAMENLKRLLSTFDFKYPGDVTINFEEMAKQGTDMRKDIEDQVLKEASSPDFFIVK